MYREKIIQVPKNEKAMKDYDYGMENPEEIEEVVFSEEESKILDDIGIFHIINEKCDIIIDEYEEEWLELEKIPVALDAVNQVINCGTNEALDKLKKILEMALTYKTMVSFVF